MWPLPLHAGMMRKTWWSIEVDLFRMEVLQRRGMDQIFETDSIKSFISELNLYGFSKICPSCHSAGKKMMMVTQKALLQRLIRQAECWMGFISQEKVFS